MSPATPRMTAAQIAHAMNLLKDADSVELKLTVKESDQRSAIQALDLEILDAELRQVVFFDTRDLKLSKHGVVVRARRIRKGGDTVVKLRPIVPADLSANLRKSESFNVEVDAAPGNLVCSGSLKGRTSNLEVKQVLLGKRPIRKLFSSEQRVFYKSHAPKGVDLDSLIAFGPINVAKLKCMPNGFKGRLAAEVWFYPDSSRILELSTKCTPDETFQVVAETRAYLGQHGIDLTADQQMKTRKALEYFSRITPRVHR